MPMVVTRDPVWSYGQKAESPWHVPGAFGCGESKSMASSSMGLGPGDGQQGIRDKKKTRSVDRV